jgi:hypothetical protein
VRGREGRLASWWSATLTGSSRYNDRLSERRAETVRRALGGIDQEYSDRVIDFPI